MLRILETLILPLISFTTLLYSAYHIYENDEDNISKKK